MNTTLQTFPIAHVHPTADNARIILKNDPALAALAESIAAAGIIQPPLGRPHPRLKGHVELRAGERRLRAAQIAKLETIDILLRDMSDAEALEITIAENLNREDLRPMEEAKVLQTYLDRGWSCAAIARHLGQTEKWVRMRANLHALSPAWLAAMADNEQTNIADWSAPALAVIARLPEATQDAILEHHAHHLTDAEQRPPSTDQVAEVAGKLTRLLKQAPWVAKKLPGQPASEKDDPSLLPLVGRCADCLKRSSRQPDLFGEDDPTPLGKTDRCLDSACWELKTKALVQLQTAHLKAKHPGAVAIRHSWSTVTDEEAAHNPALQGSVSQYDVQVVTQRELPPEERTRAIHVDGPNAGQTTWIRKPEKPAKATGKDPQAKLDDLLRKRQLAFIETVRCMVDSDQAPYEVARLAEMAACFGTISCRTSIDLQYEDDDPLYSDPWAAYESENISAEQHQLYLHTQVMEVIAMRITSPANIPAALAEANRIGDHFGYDLQPAIYLAIQKHPMPKSWAKGDAQLQRYLEWEAQAIEWADLHVVKSTFETTKTSPEPPEVPDFARRLVPDFAAEEGGAS